ncbi:hypothetical protein XENOCAPTIV_020201 [Xenoophorus captivus]|uniref:Uncharacterized protein n=1 Tax=Xenoophorus captivus TaxID=1517983 RepID=A0ABV0QEL9_9TELE
MLRQSAPTSSTLHLVASDMTSIMEQLDTKDLYVGDGEFDTTDAGTCCCFMGNFFTFHICCRFVTVSIFLAGDRLPFPAIYKTVGFKEPNAMVFLSSPITAKILEVERYTANPDRFNSTKQRSVNKISPEKKRRTEREETEFPAARFLLVLFRSKQFRRVLVQMAESVFRFWPQF